MADATDEDRQLREDLAEFGETVGKINDKTRPILIKKLNHLRARKKMAEAPPSPGRGRGRGGARKKTPVAATTASTRHSSSGDESDTESSERSQRAGSVKATSSQKQMNLRRRTVDVGFLADQNDNAVHIKQEVEQKPTPSRPATRRSLGSSALSDSPFLAGSLRNPNPLLSASPSRQAKTKSTPLRTRSGYSFNDDDQSGSDNDFTFVEMASMGVNTTQSLKNMCDTPSSSRCAGDLHGDHMSRSGHNLTLSDEANGMGRIASNVSHIWTVLWHAMSQFVLFCVPIFFVLLALLYAFAVYSDTRSPPMIHDRSTFLKCDEGKSEDYCVKEFEIQIVTELVRDLMEILSRRAGDYECGYGAESRFLKKDDVISTLEQEYGRQDDVLFKKALTAIILNKQWGIRLFNKTHEETDDIEQVEYLDSAGADKSLWCRLSTSVCSLRYYIVLIVAAMLVVILISYVAWYKWKKSEKETKEVHQLVKDIIDLLHNHSRSCQTNKDLEPYLAVPHIHDALIPLADRKNKKHIWRMASNYLSTNESRIRQETRTVNGEECSVWRWIDTISDGSSLSSAWPRSPSYSMTKCGSACLRICNMLSTPNNFSEAIIYDAVLDRCGLHSGILHIGISSAAQDSVYVKFVSEAAAGKAYSALHGWVFDGRLTSVKEVGPAMYRMLFPESVNAMVPLRSSNHRRQSRVF